jgi:hypothetical protein
LITGAKALRHAAKGDALTAEDWRALPRSLRSAEVVLFDKKTGHLLYVFPAVDDPRKAKVVVHVDRVEKDSRLNSIRTAFKVQRGNLSQAQGFDVVRGELK